MVLSLFILDPLTLPYSFNISKSLFISLEVFITTEMAWRLFWFVLVQDHLTLACHIFFESSLRGCHSVAFCSASHYDIRTERGCHSVALKNCLHMRRKLRFYNISTGY